MDQPAEGDAVMWPVFGSLLAFGLWAFAFWVAVQLFRDPARDRPRLKFDERVFSEENE